MVVVSGLGNVIDAALRPGVAACDPPDAEADALDDAVLLDRLEGQGRRRAAVEIDEESAALKRDLERCADAERARRIERTLAALEPYTRVGALPPFPLREQIRQLVGRRQEPRGL